MQRTVISALFLASATHASAQVLDSATVNVTGFIPDVCQVDGIRSIDLDSLSGAATGGSTGDGVKAADVAFDFAVANASNASANSVGRIGVGSVDVGFDLYCNGPFQLTIAATNGAMVNDESLVNAADFADRIAYTADFTFPDGSAAPTASSTGAPGTLVFVPDADPQDGRAAFSVEVANPSDGRKPIAGVYREAFRLSFVQDGQIPASSFP